MRPVLALALVFALTAACQAAGSGKQAHPKFSLPSAQLGDYSLKLDTDAPTLSGAPDPGALTPLRQDSVRPFVGFSLSRPIGDKFWKFGR